MVKKCSVIILAALIAMFLQSALFGTFLPRWMVPNLCMVVVVYIGVYEATPLGAVLSFIVGLLLDLSSGQLIGPWSGAFSAIFGVLSQGGRRIFLDSAIMIALMVFGIALCGSLVYLFLLSQFRLTGSDIFSTVLLGTALTTALLAPAVFSVLKKLLVRKSQSRYLS